jgi:type I protein arginine methyltransferase
VKPAAAYEVEQIGAPWSERLSGGWGDDFHALLLGDELRMRAYAQAIRDVVEPGMVVLDLGTGTGVLARWALEAGARRVYGIERDAALLDRTASDLATAGFATRFVPVAGLSHRVQLPERVDLIVSEILGNLVDNEGFTGILADAVTRFLAPHGRRLPWRAQRYLAPVEAPRAHAAVAAGRSARATDTGPSSPFDTYYDAILPRIAYLASPRSDRTFDLDAQAATAYRSELVFPVDRPGCFTGFKGWFVADLSPTVALDIAGDGINGGPPGRTTSDSWKHAYLPIEHPATVETHDRIAVALTRQAPDKESNPFAQSYTWTGAVWRGDREVARFAQQSAPS